MRLIVTDMDGTLLNSRRQIPAANAAALQMAQSRGCEIAIATGRTYANALALCRDAGLNPHIISNHGAFVHSKSGKRLLATGLAKARIQRALTWLDSRRYYYNICTDTHSYVPAGSDRILAQDYQEAGSVIDGVTAEAVKAAIAYFCRASAGRTLVSGIDEILDKDLAYGSIVAISFDRDKLAAGRSYFGAAAGLALNIAGDTIFELVDAGASKGLALERLCDWLRLPLAETMAIGDHYNDLSMLRRAGLSIAMGNAEAAVKSVCNEVTLTNDCNGVAACVRKHIG